MTWDLARNTVWPAAFNIGIGLGLLSAGNRWAWVNLATAMLHCVAMWFLLGDEP